VAHACLRGGDEAAVSARAEPCRRLKHSLAAVPAMVAAAGRARAADCLLPKGWLVLILRDATTSQRGTAALYASSPIAAAAAPYFREALTDAAPAHPLLRGRGGAGCCFADTIDPHRCHCNIMRDWR
jgi:hypothetical protein